jgi:phosphoglycolate phosphatase-like HAD superfamily hydrolase
MTEMYKQPPSYEQPEWGVFFDLDGVLVHSAERNFIYYVEVFETAQRELNLPNLFPPAPEAIVSCYSLGLVDAIATLTPPEYAEFLPQIIEIARENDRHSDLLWFPEHLSEHLEEMRDDNCGMVIVTNAPLESVEEVFDANPGLVKNFDSVVADARKPSPDGLLLAMDQVGVEAERAVMIGDTASTDGEAARNAGIKFIHFTSYEFDPQADIHVRPNIGDSKFSLSGLTSAVRSLRAPAVNFS